MRPSPLSSSLNGVDRNRETRVSAFWERGSPDLPACSPRRGSSGGGARTTHLHQQGLKTLARGQASRGGRHKTSSEASSPGWLVRGGEIKARQTSRGPRDVSNDDRDQAGARRAPARAASLFPLLCQGGKRRRGVPRHQAKVSISVQRDQDQQDGKTEVTMEPKAASPPEPFVGEDCFCQDKLY